MSTSSAIGSIYYNTVQVPVRQTVMSGVTNSTGQGNALTTGSGLQPGINTGTGSNPLIMTFANGFSSNGTFDYVEQITADQSTYWTATANNLSYLAVTRTGTGTFSPYTTLAPIQYGYAYNPAAQSALSLNNKSTDDFGNTWTNTSVTFTNTTPEIAGSSYGVFNGTTSKIATTAITSLGSSSWSLRGWFRATSLAASSPMITALNAGGFGVLTYITTGGKFQLYLSSNGTSANITNATTGTATLVTNTWYFIEIVFDSVAGKYFTYVNGVVDQTITSSLQICGFTTLSIGVDSGGSHFFTGNAQGFEMLPYCQHPDGTTYTSPTTLADITATGYSSDWFDISTYTAKKITTASATAGNNPIFTIQNRLYIGETVTGASTVSTVTTYAYQGTYDGPFTATLPGTSVLLSVNHNIGVQPKIKAFVISCTTPDQGYSVGDEVSGLTGGNSSYGVSIGVFSTTKVGGLQTGNSSAFIFWPKSGSNSGTPTASSWKYRFTFQRGW